jgi:protein SCO1/2
MTRTFTIVAAASLAGLLGILVYAVTLGRPDDQFAQCRATKVATSGGGSQIGGPFTLVDEGGKTVTASEVIDQPSLLYFGYTFCPDVCPLDNARNAEAIEILENAGTIVKPVFISIDPARDTPEVLRDFTDNLHPRMVGLTGTPEQVKAASQAYRTYYKRREAEDNNPEFYLMDHSTTSYLVMPKHGFVEFFTREVTPDDMAKRMQCFVDAQ